MEYWQNIVTKECHLKIPIAAFFSRIAVIIS